MTGIDCVLFWECVEECVKRRLPFHDIFLEGKVYQECVEFCREKMRSAK
jgi:hypothetical protein